MYTKTRKIVLMLLLLSAVLTLTAVSANENLTQNTLSADDASISVKESSHSFEDIQNEINNSKENSTVILNGTYVGSGKEILINKSITLEGCGNSTILDANSTSRILNITAGTVTLKNLIFANAKNTISCGGAIYSTESLTVDGCTFKDNVVDFTDDSGLSSEEIYERQVYEGIYSIARGGAIYCGDNLTVLNSKLSANRALSTEVWREMEYYGGQDNAGATTIHAKGNIILDNTTVSSYSYFGTCDIEAENNLVIWGCEFNGARSKYGRSISVNNSKFNDRSTLETYGSNNDSCTILNSDFINPDGLVLSASASSVVIENNTFANGDVEYADFIKLSAETIEISGNDFSNNSIRYHDLIRITATECSMFNNTFTDNQVTGISSYYAHCSIVLLQNSNASVIQCSFTNNSAPTAGAIHCMNSNLSVESSNFTENSNVAVELENSNLKVNGQNCGYYLKALLDDSFATVGEGVEIDMPKTFTFAPAKTIEIKIPAKVSYNKDMQVSFFVDVLKEGKAVYSLLKDSENGYLKFSLKDLAAGTYEIKITSQNWDVEKTSTLIIGEAKVTASNAKVTYSAGSYYTINVKGADGKPADGAKVVIKINGKTFKTLYTSKGVAKFKVDNAPGTYKMTITSLGKSVTKTLTVNHVVSLQSVTVKRSAKKLVLSANLGKVNNKYLKNKWVTFKFNGKTYKAKTNSKGVAKVTVKSNVLKKLKVGKKVTYQATYLKDTVKKTAKIKK